MPLLRGELIKKKKTGYGHGHIPSVVFISCTLAVMHAGGCRLGLADHSSSERANRRSVASPNRGDLPPLKLGQESGEFADGVGGRG